MPRFEKCGEYGILGLMKFLLAITAISVIVGTLAFGAFAMTGTMENAGDCPIIMLNAASCVSLVGAWEHALSHLAALHHLSLGIVQANTTLAALAMAMLTFGLFGGLMHPVAIRPRSSAYRREDDSRYSLQPLLRWFSQHEHSPTLS